MIGRIGRILSDVVPLRRGEWKLALFLYGILTLMVAADWVGKLGADALFVKRYGVNEIPKMYIVTPLVMLAVSAVLTAIAYLGELDLGASAVSYR